MFIRSIILACVTQMRSCASQTLASKTKKVEIGQELVLKNSARRPNRNCDLEIKNLTH